MCTSVRQSLWSSNGGCQVCLLTFDSLCGARTGVDKRAIAFVDLERGLENSIFSLTYEKNVSTVKNDVIIRFSWMASKLSPSIK